jgi:hypothetical protein
MPAPTRSTKQGKKGLEEARNVASKGEIGTPTSPRAATVPSSIPKSSLPSGAEPHGASPGGKGSAT